MLPHVPPLTPVLAHHLERHRHCRPRQLAHEQGQSPRHPHRVPRDRLGKFARRQGVGHQRPCHSCQRLFRLRQQHALLGQQLVRAQLGGIRKSLGLDVYGFRESALEENRGRGVPGRGDDLGCDVAPATPAAAPVNRAAWSTAQFRIHDAVGRRVLARGAMDVRRERGWHCLMMSAVRPSEQQDRDASGGNEEKTTTISRPRGIPTVRDG